jgi:hypothetical protein
MPFGASFEAILHKAEFRALKAFVLNLAIPAGFSQVAVLYTRFAEGA